MTNNFKKDDDEEMRELVLAYETSVKEGSHRYFDVDEMEIVIDYYLENTDIEHLEEAVCYAERLFPDATSIRLRRSHLLCTQGLFDKALPILRELVRLEPDNTDVHYALGAIYSTMGQPKKAIQHYLLAAKDKYCLDTIYGNVADEYRNLERLEEAIHYYKKALSVNPTEERSLQNIVFTFDISNRLKDGEKYFSDMVERHPYNHQAWCALGFIYFYLGLYEKAIDAQEYAIAIDKTFYDAYSCIANCHMAMNEPGKAATTLLESIPYAETPELIYSSIGSIYHDIGNLPTAVIYFRKALQIDPNMGDALRGIAFCYDAMGDHGTASTYIERAIDSNPPLAEFHHDAAIIQSCNDIEAAVKHFETALDIDNTHDEYWIDYALFLYALKEYEQSLTLMEAGVESANEPTRFQAVMAACHFMLGHLKAFSEIAITAQEQWDDWKEMFLHLCPDAEPYLP
ncbi:MAG: tetratricopeptide repeat protein [Bacteroidales bacterium]|nr:tetratricopeptide repeat protein [Bacteroidales bacterium]